MPSAPSPPSSVLLLERGRADPEVAPTSVPRPPAAVVHLTAPARTVRPVGPPESLLRAPGLALLAATGALEAYRWFGIVPDRAERPVALAFILVALAAAAALTRTGGRRARTAAGRALVAAAGAASLATLVVLWDDGGWARATVGVADLVLGATALVALAVGERSRRRGDVAP